MYSINNFYATHYFHFIHFFEIVYTKYLFLIAQSAGAEDPPPTSVLDMTLKIWWWGSSDAGALGNADYPFIAIAPRSTLARSGSTW